MIELFEETYGMEGIERFLPILKHCLKILKQNVPRKARDKILEYVEQQSLNRDEKVLLAHGLKKEFKKKYGYNVSVYFWYLH